MAGLSEPLYAKLKPGPGKSSKAVFANQRARLFGAMVALTADRGFEDVTVRGLAGLAGISTGTFYRHFPNAEHCFGHACEWLVRSSLRRATVAQRGCADWEAGVRAALQSILDDLSRHPRAARIVLVESCSLLPELQAGLDEEVAAFGRLLDGDPASESAVIPDPIHCGIVVGVTRVARTRMLLGELECLPGDGPELADWIIALCRMPAIDWEGPNEPVTRTPESETRLQEDLRRAIGGSPGDEDGRVLAAVAKLSIADGYAELTMPRIRAEAGVTRRYLDGRFACAEGCFLATIEAIGTHAAFRAAQAARPADDWTAGVEAAIRCLCEEIASNPSLAHLVFAEVLAPGRQGLLCRERLITLAAAGLRAALPAGQRPSQLVAEASSAALWDVVRADVAARRPGAAPRLAPILLNVALIPAVRGSGVERHLVPNLDP